MTIFITLFLTIAAFTIIIFPFFSRRLQKVGLEGDEKLQELRSERDTTYSMLKELQFDFQSGLLTEEDYKELETRYRRKAISTLRQLDITVGHEKSEPGGEVEDEIEKKVRKLRGEFRHGTAPEKDLPTKDGVKSQAKPGFCTECGTRVSEIDKFCAGCGSSLVKEG